MLSDSPCHAAETGTMSSPSHHILIVEDEADLADLVAYNLRKSGFQTHTARDGGAALEILKDSIPDLVILDLMLPGVSGIEVARQIRTSPRTAGLPILMMTARAGEPDQVAGFRAGADDYVTKPFSMKVLVARVQALLRRAKGPGIDPSVVLAAGAISMDVSVHEASMDGEPLRLTLTEFRLLASLIRGKGRVLSREDLMYAAMGPEVMVTPRTIDVHMAAIRRKLGLHGGMIRTVRGVGYILTTDPGAETEHAEGATDGEGGVDAKGQDRRLRPSARG
jgi:DNA-binding response OmpR family regulator